MGAPSSVQRKNILWFQTPDRYHIYSVFTAVSIVAYTC